MKRTAAPLPSFKFHSEGCAFIDRLCQVVDLAQEEIHVRAFLWRDDKVGLLVMAALVRAAERGVEVFLRKDAVGWVFERGEEDHAPLFPNQYFWNWPKAALVGWAYGPGGKAPPQSPTANELLVRMQGHPRIHLTHALLHDHSKVVVVDGRWIFLGSQNLEARTCSLDRFGMPWQDLMIELEAPSLCDRYFQRLAGAELEVEAAIDFLLNDPADSPHQRFEWKPTLLALIRDCQTAMTFMMPYIGEKEITQELCRAMARGVKLNMVLPRKANVQQMLNSATTLRLLAQGAEVGFSDKMIHAKAAILDDLALVGSANLNASSNRLGETVLMVRCSEFTSRLASFMSMNVNSHFSRNNHAAHPELKWPGRVKLKLEHFVMA